MDGQPMSLEERRSALEAPREALAGWGSVLHQASGPELAELMTLVDGVSAHGAAARVAITVEAVIPGEVAESGSNAHAWVREHAPSLRQGGAGAVAKVAEAVVPAASQWRPEGGDVDPGSSLGIVWAGTGSNLPVLVPSTNPGSAPARSIAGVPVVVTAGIPDDEAVVADASRIVVVMRKDGRVEVDRSVKFLIDGVAVRLVMRLAFAVPYVGAVVRIKDVP